MFHSADLLLLVVERFEPANGPYGTDGYIRWEPT